MIGVIALLFMVGVVMRVLPLYFSKELQKIKSFEQLGHILPPTLLILLVVHCLVTGDCGSSEIIGIASTALLQMVTGNLLVSMLCGVAVHQGLLHLL